MVLFSRQEPKPAPFGAPAESFSAERARVILDRLVGDGAVHPVGSMANDVVRDRVIAELTAVGLRANVESGFACSARGSCADVQNIVASIPGAKRGPAVVLNAHYDSVPASSGGGDDAASVAALVEVARALRAGPPPPRDVIILIDDGEEAGLLGAEAYVRKHDPASFHAMIVLEARGSSGRALMFETSRLNEAVVDAYARAVPSPSTSSLSFSVYERLPNATNFTVFKREGMRGLTLGFIDDAAQYHTPANSAKNVPSGTIQHMGETALGLARSIGGAKLESAGNSSYFDLLGLAVIRWPEPWNSWLAIVAAILVVARMVLALRRGDGTVRGSAVALVAALLSVAAAGLAARGLLALSLLRTHGAAWPANGDWLEASAWAVAIAAVSYATHLARLRVSPADGWNAFGIVWSVVSIALAFALPGGAYCFFVALIAGAVVSLAGGSRGLRAAPLVTLAVGGALLFNVAIDLPLAMGNSMLPAPAVIVALLSLACVPLLLESGLALRTGNFGLLLAIAALTGFFVTPVWTPLSPRPMNFVQLDANDAGDARLMVTDFGSGDPPAPIASAAAWARGPVAELGVGSRRAVQDLWSSKTPASGEPAPSASLESWAPLGDARIRATIRVRSNRAASVVRLRADLALDAKVLRVGAHAFAVPAELGVVTIHTVGVGGVEIVFEFKPRPGATITIEDETPELPPSARAVAMQRTESMAPIHRGDRLIVSNTLPLTPALR
ncbi:MAG: M20/M25/M40 family metallo-hydrolase [Thermoanaerobaculia bacterium]|nr:M20/M25/M40 family metallo-hydrolase [Thermoanaerobaculia bacterium]